MTTTTIEARVNVNDLKSSWLQTSLKLSRELKSKGVPVVGAAAIRYVRSGTLEQFQDGDEYVWRWTGEPVEPESELI